VGPSLVTSLAFKIPGSGAGCGDGVDGGDDRH
jgi:hypothetical protein